MVGIVIGFCDSELNALGSRVHRYCGGGWLRGQEPEERGPGRVSLHDILVRPASE